MQWPIFFYVVKYGLIDLFCHLEFSLDDKVNVVNFGLTLFVDDLSSIKLNFFHVVEYLCDDIGPQIC